TAPLSFGETYSGTLSDANPSAHFAFAASRGDMLRLVANQIDENGSNTFEVQLVAPEGYIFSSLSPAYYGPDAQSEFVLDPITLESTGQFLIVVHRIDVSGNGIAGDVSYAFTLSRTETPLIVPGEAIEGSFADPNVYEVVYRMEGAAGMPVRITLSNLDEGYTPSMDVQGPQAEDMSATGGMGYGGGGSMTLVTMTSTVPGTLTAEVTLPTTGIYLFRVHNGVYMYGPGPADQAATASETGGGYRLLVEITE
ncbi:MAG: hypothetical protein JW910_16840, partial [Anaerolineae bacterium]|nr:hypothetical protein [Anaerolineae bacterium]